MEQFHEYHLAIDMWRYMAPPILVVGTGGNLLSLLVLTRKRLRGSTTMLYLAVLAAVDLAVLYTGLLRLYLQMAHGYNLRLASDASCKIHSFLVYFLLDLSVWLIAAVTTDRCIHVVAPFRGRRVSSVKTAGMVVALLVVVLALINCHLFWTATLRQVDYWGGGLACDHHHDYDYFMTKVWPKIDLVVFFGLPFTVMLISNLLIIRTFTRSSKNLRGHASQAEAKPEEPSFPEREQREVSNAQAHRHGSTWREPSVSRNDNSERRHSIIIEEPEVERMEAEEAGNDAIQVRGKRRGERDEKDDENDPVKDENDDVFEDAKDDCENDDGEKMTRASNDDRVRDEDESRNKTSKQENQAQNRGNAVSHVTPSHLNDVTEPKTRRPWWKCSRKVADISQGQAQLQNINLNKRRGVLRSSRNGNRPQQEGCSTEGQDHNRNCTQNGGIGRDQSQGQGQGQGQDTAQGRRASQRRSRASSECAGGKSTSWVTVTLLVMSAVFLVLTAPVVIYLIGFELAWSSNLDPHAQARLTLAWAVTNLLQYANSAATFYLYCLTGPRFRRELAALLSCRGARQVSPGGQASGRHVTQRFRHSLD